MIYKKIISFILIFFIILLNFSRVYAAVDDPFPGQFKDGTSLSYMQSNHQDAILTNWILAGLYYSGVGAYVSGSGVDNASQSVGRYFHDIYDQITEVEGLSYIREHLTCTVDADNNAIMYGIDDAADETTFRTYARALFRELVFQWSGDDAAVTSPFDYVSDDGYFYIYFNGQFISPWVIGSDVDYNYPVDIENNNLFLVRGDVFDADVGAWVTGLQNNTERYINLQMPCRLNDDNIGLLYSGNYSLINTDTIQAIKTYSIFTPSRYYYWTSLNLTPPNSVDGVIVPCVYYTNIGSVSGYYLRLFQYSYVSSGLRPTDWGNNNAYCWAITGYSTKPVKQYSAGDIVYSSTGGVDVSDLDYYVNNITDNQWVIYNTGDVTNMGDIVNNYYNNDYNIYFNADPSAPSPSDKVNPFTDWKWPHLSSDGDGGFNFDFDLPDINIDWSIDGITEKFPFSIPWDIARFYAILNAEPEAPHFETSIPFGDFYTWEFEFDFEQFDDLAALVRLVEYVAFCFGLILATREYL